MAVHSLEKIFQDQSLCFRFIVGMPSADPLNALTFAARRTFTLEGLVGSHHHPDPSSRNPPGC